jgi:hypothetical protein
MTVKVLRAPANSHEAVEVLQIDDLTDFAKKTDLTEILGRLDRIETRLAQLEAQLGPPDRESGTAVLTQLGGGPSFHAVVILHWRPSRVTASMPGVQPGGFSYQVNIRDDGFELTSPVLAGTFDWTAYR